MKDRQSNCLAARFLHGGSIDPWAGTLSSRPEVLPGSDSSPCSLRGIPRTLPIRQKLTSLDRTGGNLYMYESRFFTHLWLFLPVPVLVAFPTSTGVLPVLSTFLRGALRALHPPCSELGGDYTLPSARGSRAQPRHHAGRAAGEEGSGSCFS